MNKQKTKDLYLAAALVASGEELLSSERVGNEVWFYFKDSQSFDMLRNQYFTGELNINVARYQNALRQLKSIIFHT